MQSQMIDQVEKSAKKCMLGEYTIDSRGGNKKTTLGSMLERGGSGKIHLQKHKTKTGMDFLKKNELLIEEISQIMSAITPTQSFLIDYVPKEHRAMKKFGLCFWNRTPISRLLTCIAQF